ncbi:bifunctional riboflavin kinase/FAD synthetase [Pedosphaera parvula]|uniref:Riboflavin biosynthesis protein n=1 Tax=Pedosphaera parvula (strain Ellin514) TaxID=320771 RepID=B9XFC6_PEDPL|nr:bifunctional riboflavin kinase/FAD synthetase [Pedosphaera parvula]EEF61290.1 riboflavin biosynthesis protein RibF [Pedosphaera parvula Ellin514]
MKIIRSASELKANGRKVCLAIGFFDGVHLGHQQIIRQTIADSIKHEAVSLVVTFDQHPSTVVAPDRIPPLIYPLPHKLKTIGSLGSEALFLIHFDKAFSELSGEAFIRNLANDLGHIESLCVGSNFTFGYKRSGNVALLKTLGEELKFTVHGMAAVSLDGKTVSSTRIREAIRTGELDAASQMLGRTYSLCGPVIKGDQLGHKLGFPTANLKLDGLVLPPTGVYAVHAFVEGESYRAVVNIGLRPTLRNPAPERRIEVHILNFTGDLYGKAMEIAFVEKLRDEQKFPSLDALKLQIAKDIEDAAKCF